MPLIRITANEGIPRLHGATAPLGPTLQNAIQRHAGSVVIMVHGYKYAPGHHRHCPHEGILSLAPRRSGKRIRSWPRALGFNDTHKGAGLAISFGWPARGTIRQAYAAAAEAGAALARLVAMIHRMAPDRPCHVIGHSLGARVALRALSQAEPGQIDRLILLAAAEFAGPAEAALASAAGRSAHVLNVTSGENALFDLLLERFLPPPARGDRSLGRAGIRGPRVATLALDDAESLAALAGAGFTIGGTTRRVCHWSAYLRPGVFALYRAFLDGRLGAADLRAILPRPMTSPPGLAETRPLLSWLAPTLPRWTPTA